MLWGFCLATNDVDPAQISREEIDRRISERVTRELRFYDGITHQALFNISKYVRRFIEGQLHVNLDNNPLIEQFPGLSGKD
jgi:spermidine synthase